MLVPILVLMLLPKAATLRSCGVTPDKTSLMNDTARHAHDRPGWSRRERTAGGPPAARPRLRPGSLSHVTTPGFEETRPQDYLLRLAASDLGRAYKNLAVGELGIRPGDTVLDLGCGPGADLPAFAEAAGREGRVIGVDHDAAAVAEAAGRVAGLPQVEVLESDVHALDLPDASVDRVHADRVLQHVADPAAVLREARRVLGPGGGALFAEPDWDTLIIDYPDLAVPRAYTRFVAERVVRNACIGRQLAGLATRAGFEVSNVIPITGVFRDARAADKVLGLARVTRRAVSQGYLAEEMAGQWLDHLIGQPFFGSLTLFFVIAAANDAPG
jgi:ubiquinone/menaquinone biosynthesis C-methylase UbiE